MVFESWFAQTEDPRVLDLHTRMRERRAIDDREIYFRDDTHQNWHGRSVMAETIVNSLQPGIWQPEYLHHGRTITYPGDLLQLAGITSLPLRQKEVLAVSRPGVTPRRVHFEGEVYENFLDVDADPYGWQYPVRAEFETTGESDLIPGRTLILHDSCIGSIARPLLRPYFEDVEFIHYDDATPEMIDQSMKEYDAIVLEIVERNAPEKLVTLLAPPDPEAPAILWDPGTEPTWSIKDAGDEDLQTAEDIIASVEDGQLLIHTDRETAAVLITDVDLPAGHRHIVKIVMSAPGLGLSILYWSSSPDEEMSPERKQARAIRGGRNEFYLLIDEADPISRIMLEPGAGEGDYVIETLDIQSIPADDPGSQ